ncbi:helix-turn-helix transcriptional regulator [Streptomyces rimosus]|uniref:helix-turn-helix transcriptional regulator n=1 Tax=Streptomyces rimosus TaxID=1927 RepID=UPI0004C48A73|nr:hypothetical protein [Streptomyces rimosus]
MDYDFTFVVTGATVDDQDAVDALRETCDALLARAGGVDLLSVSWPGDCAVQAALEAASAIRATVPRLRVCRLDRDLVGIHEIAERTGRSRQNVAQWVAGARKARGAPFPAPEGTVGRSQAWLWSEVNHWLAAHGLDDGAAHPTREEMAQIDVALAGRISLTFRFATTPGFKDGRQRVIDELRSRHISRFLTLLAGFDGTTDEHGNHVLVVADGREPARGVMECVARFPHDAVLVTDTDRFTVTVLSSRGPARSGRVVPVPASATVGEWLRLVRDHPRAAFAMETGDRRTEEPARIQWQMAIAA